MTGQVVRRIRAWPLSAFLAALLAAPMSRAAGQEAAAPSRVEEEAARLEAELDREHALAPETRDALRGLVGAIRAERAEARQAAAEEEGTGARPAAPRGVIARIVDEYLEARPPAPEPAPWEAVLERLKPFGDLRLRHESDFELDDRTERNRERIRLRLGASFLFTDELRLEARLVTGDPDDPNSPHVTLADLFDSFDVSLDRAFVSYRPAWLEGAWLTAGKFGHPFYQNPVYPELVWDADVQPEGIVSGYTLSRLGAIEELKLVAGEYLLLEQRDEHEAFLTVGQVAGRLRLGEALRLDAALGYYHYSNLTPGGSRALLGDDAGNATRDENGDGVADDFRSRFGIADLIVALTYRGWVWPITLSGEYIRNVRAHGHKEQGWALGASVGGGGRQWDWRVYYQWQVVERDAVFSAFSQDDLLLATNHRSHILGASLILFDGVELNVWALASSRDDPTPGLRTDSDAYQWRVRADLNIKF